MAVCKGADSKWREFDDEVVTELTTADLTRYDTSTQVLILERQD